VQYTTKARTLLKTISWRTVATLTTAVLVYIFTGEFALAITVGSLEVVAKMIFYFVHERIWEKIKFGKKEVPSFVVWVTGLPASGKRELADKLAVRLKEKELKVERIDSHGVRPLFPETGFSPDEVDMHIRRVGHLCAMLEKNGVIVIANFVSPYYSSRRFARKQAKNFVEVFLKTTPEACRARDDRGRYEKALAGEFKYFPGVDVDYQEPEHAEMIIDVDQEPIDNALQQVEAYLQKNLINHS
jgi:adenylylsulfate kinase